MLKTNTIQIDQEILQLISEIDEFKGSWKALGLLAPERLSMLRKVASVESTGSSTRIEGSKLSDRDVEMLLSNLEIKSFETRDEQEVAGYSLVMELIFQSWDEMKITLNNFIETYCSLHTAMNIAVVSTKKLITVLLPSMRMENRLELFLRRQHHLIRLIL